MYTLFSASPLVSMASQPLTLSGYALLVDIPAIKIHKCCLIHILGFYCPKIHDDTIFVMLKYFFVVTVLNTIISWLIRKSKILQPLFIKFIDTGWKCTGNTKIVQTNFPVFVYTF